MIPRALYHNCRALLSNVPLLILGGASKTSAMNTVISQATPKRRYFWRGTRIVPLACVIVLSMCAVAMQRQQPVTPQSEVDGLLRQAVGLLQAGRLDEAEPLLRRALQVAPQNADAHNLLGTIFDQRGRAAEAEHEYREALRLNPSSISAQANLGVLFARTNRSGQAILILESVLRAAPDHPQATSNLGLLYAAGGDDARALPLLERANSQRPNTYEVILNLGVVLYRLARLDEAAIELQAASRISTTAADPLYYLGLISSARGADEAAIELWQQVLQKRANFADANFMIGEAVRRTRGVAAAKEFYERALSQDATKFVYYARLGGVYLSLDQADAALEVFDRAAQRFPAVAEAHYFVGIAARRKGAFDVAEAALRRSLALKPDNSDALAQLGYIASQQDKLAEAEVLLRRAVALGNRHIYAHYNLGRILVKLRRYEEAAQVLEQAATISKDCPEVHYQLFLAYSRLKRKPDADRELTIFKELEASGVTRQRNLSCNPDNGDPSSAFDGKPGASIR